MGRETCYLSHPTAANEFPQPHSPLKIISHFCTHPSACSACRSKSKFRTLPLSYAISIIDLRAYTLYTVTSNSSIFLQTAEFIGPTRKYSVQAIEIGPSNVNCHFYCGILASAAAGFPSFSFPFHRYSHIRGFPANIRGIFLLQVFTVGQPV